MRKVLVILPVLWIITFSHAFGQVSRTAVPFLLIAPGARAGGMGETFVAIADDATATHWNPAGLGRYPLSPSWIELPTEKNQEIQKIALVKNDLPDINYRQYDVWAIINGQLAFWHGDAWQTKTAQRLEPGQSIKSILLRYTGLTEEQIAPYLDQVLAANTSIPRGDIESLQQQLTPHVPADYQYADEIRNGFEQLTTAWNDLKIKSDGFRQFEKMVENGLADGQMTTSELDSISFGFDRAMEKRSIDVIDIPYSIILGDNVNCLESHGGMLYAGTDNGFYRFDPGRNRWRPYGLADGLPSLKVTALAKFRRKSILIGTDKGLCYYDGAAVKSYSEDQTAPTEFITAITAGNENSIWAATSEDLYNFDGSSWKNHKTIEVAIGQTLDNILGSFYGAMAKINREKLINEVVSLNNIQGELTVGQKINLPYYPAFPAKILTLDTMDRSVWIGTEGGIALFDGETFYHFGYKEYRAEQRIAIKDIAGQFVPDGSPEKVDRLAAMIKNYNGLQTDFVEAGNSVMVYANALGSPIHSIAAPFSRRAFIGTSYGVVEFNDGGWSRFPKAELAKTPAHTIKAESGEIWFATSDKVYILARAMKQFTFMHSNYLVQLADDLYYEFFSFVYPTGEWGTFGLGVTFLSFGSQERRGEYGEDLGQFNSYDMAITLSYGTRLMQDLAAGISARYINSHLADVGAGQEKGKGVGFSFAVDGGILYDINRRATLATTVTNIGPEIAYIDADQADPLPSKLAVALAYKLVDSPFNKLTIVGEADKLLVDLNDDIKTEIQEIIPHLGLEYWYSNYVSLRTGYIYDKVGVQRYFTLGFSLQWTNYRFDFSYVPSSNEQYNRMGNTMRFSMNLGF